MKKDKTLISIQLPIKLLEIAKKRAEEKSLSLSAYLRLLLLAEIEKDKNVK